MTEHKIWLLRLVLPGKYGRWLTGLLLLLLLLPFFYLGAGESVERNTPTLFFSLIIAYIIPVFSFITEKSQESLDKLRPLLDLDDSAFEIALRRLDSASWQLTGTSVAAGLLAGFAHLSLIHGSPAGAAHELSTSVTGFMTAIGTLSVWTILTIVIVILIRQTILFGQLGGDHVRISLLDTSKLSPFARVSTISSLAIIGALALFPLIGFESGLNLMESLPGVLAITAPLITIFVIPVWPIHQRLLAMKKQELSTVSQRIAQCIDGNGGVNLDFENLKRLTPLLDYRREIAQVSTWPFDLGNMTTFALYLIIPPLTWTGAALIENLVDALI